MKNITIIAFLVVIQVCFVMGCGSGEIVSSTERNKPQLKKGSSDEFDQALRNYLTSLVIQANKTNEAYDDDWSFFDLFGGGFRSESVSSASVPVGLAQIDTASEYHFSSTNLIEQGVDEADLVKTDGRYLYIASSPQYSEIYIEERSASMDVSYAPEAKPASIRIMQLTEEPGAIEIASSAFPDIVTDISGIYISQVNEEQKATQILVLAHAYNPERKRKGRFGSIHGNRTLVYAFDVTDPAAPELSWTIGVEGTYVSSRRLNNRLYLVSNTSFRLSGFDPYDASDEGRRKNTFVVENASTEDVLPQAYFNSQEAGFVSSNDCLVPVEQSYDTLYGGGVMTVLAIPYAEPDKTTSMCTLETSYEVYVSNQAMYFSIGDYYREKYSTLIHKIAFTETGLEYKASGRLNGYTGWRNSNFRLSEYGDNLRVVTTEYNEAFLPTHRLHILAVNGETGQLEQLSVLPNESRPAPIGKPEEEIYGVRFLNDFAYVVTYQTTDPLYVINLKDPTSPFIEGELELPGFSEYLHPIGDDYLLGIGLDSEELKDTALVQGVKIGLFDVSDKTNPIVVSEKVIGGRGSHTPVFYDHKALTFLASEDPEHFRFALPLQVHDESGGREAWQHEKWLYSGLGMYEINIGESSEIVAKGVIKTSSSLLANYDSSPIHQARSVIVDNNVHYVLGQKVWSSQWADAENVVASQ